MERALAWCARSPGFSPQHSINKVWWCTSVIGKWRQEDQKVVLSYIVRLTSLGYLRPVFKNKLVVIVLRKREVNLCFNQEVSWNDSGADGSGFKFWVIPTTLLHGIVKLKITDVQTLGDRNSEDANSQGSVAFDLWRGFYMNTVMLSKL